MLRALGTAARFVGRTAVAASHVVQVGVSAGVVLIAYKGYVIISGAKRGEQKIVLNPNDKYVLHLDLKRTKILSANPGSVERVALSLGEQKKAMYYNDVIQVLSKAASDDQVLGLVATMQRDTGLGMATTKELREAIEKFGEKKPTAIHVETFGNVLESGLKAYYFASGFRAIGMRSTGELNIGPLRIASPFFRGLMERLGIEPEFDQRGQYKGYVDRFSGDKFSEGTKASTGGVLTDLQEQIIDSIATSRKLSVDKVKSLLSREFFLGNEAIKEKLLNFLAHEDDMITSLLRSAAARHALGALRAQGAVTAAPSDAPLGSGSGGEVTKEEKPAASTEKSDVSVGMLDFAMYAKARQVTTNVLRQPTATNPAGTITSASASASKATPASAAAAAASVASSSLTSTKPEEKPATTTPAATVDVAKKMVGVIELPEQFDAKEIQKMFKFARENPLIGAVVFRVNSPGGAVQVFETVAREVVKTKNAGKKVVVSMGDVAASGGYLVAAHANQIFAQSTTITGSIGVAAGKFAFDGFMQQWGITEDAINTEALTPPTVDAEGAVVPVQNKSTMFSKMSATQWGNFQRSLDFNYQWFKNVVGTGRKLNPEQVEAVAQGRVWTGRQASKNGLVDRIGGLNDAIQYAKSEILQNPEAEHAFLEPSWATQISKFFGNVYQAASTFQTVWSEVSSQSKMQGRVVAVENNSYIR